MNESKYLAHFGIKGQKWGERRFQNEDGTLTTEGKIRYGKGGRPYGPNAKQGRSNNPLLKRRINETYENRVRRGEQLRKEGRTMPGAVGRAIAHDILTGFAVGAPIGFLAGPDNANTVLTGARAFGVLNVGSHVVRAYQDVADMHAYDKSVKNK